MVDMVKDGWLQFTKDSRSSFDTYHAFRKVSKTVICLFLFGCQPQRVPVVFLHAKNVKQPFLPPLSLFMLVLPLLFLPFWFLFLLIVFLPMLHHHFLSKNWLWLWSHTQVYPYHKSQLLKAFSSPICVVAEVLLLTPDKRDDLEDRHNIYSTELHRADRPGRIRLQNCIGKTHQVVSDWVGIFYSVFHIIRHHFMILSCNTNTTPPDDEPRIIRFIHVYAVCVIGEGDGRGYSRSSPVTSRQRERLVNRFKEACRRVWCP